MQFGGLFAIFRKYSLIAEQSSELNVKKKPKLLWLQGMMLVLHQNGTSNWVKSDSSRKNTCQQAQQEDQVDNGVLSWKWNRMQYRCPSRLEEKQSSCLMMHCWGPEVWESCQTSFEFRFAFKFVCKCVEQLFFCSFMEVHLVKNNSMFNS